MRFLVKSIDFYKVDTVEELEKLHEELKNSNYFTLIGFKYDTKVFKHKDEEDEECQLVAATKLFNDVKDPHTHLKIAYEVDY